MTFAERERICEKWLRELRRDLKVAETFSDERLAVLIRSRIAVLKSCRPCWETAHIPDEKKGRDIPKRKPSRHMTQLMTPQQWVAK
jgi:hypothetical protein